MHSVDVKRSRDIDYITDNRHPSRDFLNRFANLVENMSYGRLNLSQAKEHVFFWGPERIIQFICDFVNTVNDKTDQKEYAVFRGRYSNLGSWLTRCDPFMKTFVYSEIENYRQFKQNTGSRRGSTSANVGNHGSAGSVHSSSGGQRGGQRVRTVSTTSIDYYYNYHTSDMISLLKLIRNLNSHNDRQSEALVEMLSPRPAALLTYFTSRFPSLVSTVYTIARIHGTLDYIPTTIDYKDPVYRYESEAQKMATCASASPDLFLDRELQNHMDDSFW